MAGDLSATSDLEQFSLMVGGLYDAAIDASQWPSALRGAREFVVGQCATVFTKDVLSHSGGVVYDDGGIDASYRDDYFRRFTRLDPTFVAQYYATIDEPMATDDFMAYDEFVTTRFYREWAQPQGLVDFVAVALEKSATSIAMFGVFRHERHGVVDDEMRDRLRLVAPHVRRAVTVARLLDSLSTTAANLSETLEGLATAVLLLDAGGNIRHANAAAHALLTRGEIMRVERSRVVAVSPQVQQELGRLVHASAAGDLSLGKDGLALPLGQQDDVDLVASILPLNERRSFARGAALALLISPGTSPSVSPVELLAKQYALTPGELRVLLALSEVGGVPEIAEALGLSKTTVKFHLANLFEKTGIHRQAGLVKLLAESALDRK
ncbi:MAG TPA: LuxR C-terminal-related transcriptional regulator [Hyphomicrobiaceae bacterium]|nr:LuxR C-terminal-related transcriptional regulator [Hyphomicrobiaceae bacterium]